MRLLLPLYISVPLFVVVTFAHMAACAAHVSAVEANIKLGGSARRGWFYRYADFVSRPVRWLGDEA